MTTYTWKTCQNNSWTNTDCWKDGAYPNDATANTTIELTSNLTITFDDNLPLGFHLGNLSITTSNGSALSFLCTIGECVTEISNLTGNADLTLTRSFYSIVNSSDYGNTISVIGAQLNLVEELPLASIQLNDSDLQVGGSVEKPIKINSLVIDNKSTIRTWGHFYIETSLCPSNSTCGNYSCTVTQSYLNYQSLTNCNS